MSNPRVISGSARGFRLRPVPGDVTRPITDRVKEALFNILGADIIGASMLDLFGGTGSVGIEALSRGAKAVCFIDNNRKAIETIKANLEHTGLAAQANVIFNDAFSFLNKGGFPAFDYVFIAPPQYKGLWQKAIQAVDAIPDHLEPDGWIIVQIDPTEYQPVELANFKEFDQRRYGDTLLVFYR